jgi:P27 family predicted phage terminase small subunit
MSVEAKRQWRKLAPRLHAAGLLSEVDGLGLAMLCEAVGQYVEGKEIVEREGAIAISSEGNVYQHPAVALMKSARSEMLKWAREFGMTPSSRSRISVEAKGEEPSLAELLFQGVGE